MAEKVEVGFEVGVGVGVVGAEAVAGEVGLGGGVEGGGEGIGPGVATGGVGAPAAGGEPAVATAGGVAVDGDEEDVVFAQLAALPLAVLLQGKTLTPLLPPGEPFGRSTTISFTPVWNFLPRKRLPTVVMSHT